MGSPYFYADLEIQGLDIELPQKKWQDKYAIAKNNTLLILVSFDFENNEPGFRFCIIDLVSKEIRESQRIEGLLNSLKIKDHKIFYNKFLYNKQLANIGQTDFSYDEEIDLDKIALKIKSIY